TILSHSLFNCLLLFILLHFHFSFFFNATATTEIYTLSLHDALPIFGDQPRSWPGTYERAPTGPRPVRCGPRATRRCSARGGRLVETRPDGANRPVPGPPIPPPARGRP